MRLLLAIYLCSVLCSKAAMFTFAPADNGLTLPTNAGLNITSQITICIWTARRPVADAVDGNGMIISKGDSIASPPREQFGLGAAHGGGATNCLEFQFYRRNSSGISQWRTANDVYVGIGPARHDFIAFTYDYSDSTTAKAYVNGVVHTGTWVANDPVNVGPTNNNTFNMHVEGGRMTGNPCGGANRWLGYYSELAIWDSILTFEQLELIRKSKVKGIHKQISGSTLRLYMPLDSVADGVSFIPSPSSGYSQFPDRANFGPIATSCSGTDFPIGRGESVCSYQPNE